MSRVTKFCRTLTDRLINLSRIQRTNAKAECSGPSEKRPSSNMMKIKKWAFNLSGYNRYGLYTDDMIYEGTRSVSKAISRLPRQVADARNYRMMRALQLDFLKIHLPKEQWITYEEDRAHRYLRPYIDEVDAEMREIRQFGCTNYRRDE